MFQFQCRIDGGGKEGLLSAWFFVSRILFGSGITLCSTENYMGVGYGRLMV